MPDPYRQTFVTITPMFLFGADQQTPELRAPSLRGALRWWFRAVAGGYLVSESDLRRHENFLFGGTSDEEGGSLINIRVGPFVNGNGSGKQPMLPHKPDSSKQSWTNCIPTGSVFQVTIRTSPYVKKEDAHRVEPAYEASKALLELVAALGGLGKRVRRGYGAFQSTDSRFTTPEDVKKQVQSTVVNAQNKVTQFINTTAIRSDLSVNDVSDYPILHPNTATIHVGNAEDWPNFDVTSIKIKNLFIKRLMYKCSALKHNDFRVLGRGTPRQASTLCVSVVSIGRNKVVPVYSQFYSNTVDSVRNQGKNQVPILTPRVNRYTAFSGLQQAVLDLSPDGVHPITLTP